MEKVRKMRNKEEESFEEYQKIKLSVKKKNKNRYKNLKDELIEN